MMTFTDVDKLAQSAFMIVGGYAFSLIENKNIRIIGLQAPNHVSIIRPNGEILETNMDDIELDIVLGYWQRNKCIIEEEIYA